MVKMSEFGAGRDLRSAVDWPSSIGGSFLGCVLGRRRRRYPSLDAFASLAAPTKTTIDSLRSLSGTPKDEDLWRGRPIPRCRPTLEPTCNPARHNGPRAITAQYELKL
uniref:Uncharacterized protein n=1 Tax=Zea mays TaxID=4577 RepID=B6U840_MAIZE|nr:hypothetical protein [Zea mays]